MPLLRRIERYLRANAIAASRFGREVVGDPRFVQDLRAGRTPRPSTVARVVAWLEAAERG